MLKGAPDHLGKWSDHNASFWLFTLEFSAVHLWSHRPRRILKPSVNRVSVLFTFKKNRCLTLKHEIHKHELALFQTISERGCLALKGHFQTSCVGNRPFVPVRETELKLHFNCFYVLCRSEVLLCRQVSLPLWSFQSPFPPLFTSLTSDSKHLNCIREYLLFCWLLKWRLKTKLSLLNLLLVESDLYGFRGKHKCTKGSFSFRFGCWVQKHLMTVLRKMFVTLVLHQLTVLYISLLIHI